MTARTASAARIDEPPHPEDAAVFSCRVRKGEAAVVAVQERPVIRLGGARRLPYGGVMAHRCGRENYE
ncbi:MAG TPA: hypothetical protein DCG00_07050 [Alistipes sp.]|nr:hypothetical protein [Alistipes sp.]